jgi:hypothetical protein
VKVVFHISRFSDKPHLYDKEFATHCAPRSFICFVCGEPFYIGNLFFIAFTDRGNRTICEKCYKEVKHG